MPNGVARRSPDGCSVPTMYSRRPSSSALAFPAPSEQLSSTACSLTMMCVPSGGGGGDGDGVGEGEGEGESDSDGDSKRVSAWAFAFALAFAFACSARRLAALRALRSARRSSRRSREPRLCPSASANSRCSGDAGVTERRPIPHPAIAPIERWRCTGGGRRTGGGPVWVSAP